LLGCGSCVVPGLLAPAECAALIAHWPDAERFERTIDMAPKGYGVGAYRYWKEPLPEPAETLRRELYDILKVAADLHRDDDTIYPETLGEFQDRCRAAGQRRASSILLRYPTGGVNHPHRDIYGREWFPFQALVVLSRRGRDFRGGDFVLMEKDAPPGAGETVPLSEGDLLLFCSSFHRAGRRKVELRHAMRPVTRGERFALGLVFHMAE
ncbi:MAG: 2OG-Fe(II) oxygenase, partial [Candidatus Methylomirabilis sp.]|nr:2OG-Fe(II) oxygenase [Deltaproteobacteria bacterium]